MERSVKPTAAKTAETRGATLAVLLCFFASGMSGLVYQVIWVRELVLIFGATTFAASTVLSAFMGGLALGSYYFGRRSEKVERPLRLYGLLEIGIGVYGFLVPLIFLALPRIYQPIWEHIHLSFFALSLFRFVLAALVLLVPTVLMGATLPVLASYYASGSSRIGSRVGSLYSLNTFGAVLGAACSGFLLIPALGMRFTTITAATTNLLLGAVALTLDSLTSRGAALSKSSDRQDLKNGSRPSRVKKSRSSFSYKKLVRFMKPGDATTRETVSRTAVVVVLASFALSGFVALSYEVIWSRVLALIIGSSVYAFSIMLTTFLIGLAVGASLASRVVDRIRTPLATFAVLEIGVGLTSLAGAYLFNELPFLFVQLYRLMASSVFGLLLVARFVVSSLVMIVPTLILGALFPLVIRIAYGRARAELASGRDASGEVTQRDDETEIGSLGRTVGSAYAVNTLGAIGGAFASGFALIPLIGLLGSLRLSVALNFVIAGALFTVSRPGKARAIGFASATGLVLIVVLVKQPWDVAVMSSGVYRYAPAMSKMSRREFFDYFRLGNQGEAVYYKEGITATVVVQRQEGGRVLKVNGKPDASTGSDLPTQVLIGSLPLLVRDRADDVLVIGLGSGVTLGSVEQFAIKRVTCVELEPAVIEASHQFDDLNNRPLEDPRLTLVANDGRNFIDTTAEQFDVIVSEPSNPWLTGVSNLFTLEYFKRGAERLRDDGIFSQWLQIYEMPPEDVKALVATFHAAFPYVSLFRGAGSDLMLLGSKRPLEFDLSVINSHFANAKIAADLRRVQVTGAADIVSYFYFGPQGVAKYSSGAPLNTDDNALIEFRAPRQVGSAEETVEINLKELLVSAKEDGRPAWRSAPVIREGGEAEEASYPLLAVQLDGRGTASFLLDVALSAIKREDTGRAEQFVHYSMDLAETARGFSILGEIQNARGDNATALENWQRALELDSDHFYTLVNMGKYYLTRQDVSRAAPYLDRAIQIEPNSARAHHLRGLAFQAVGDNARAASEYRKVLPDAQYARSIKSFYLNFGTALVSLGLYEEAAQMLEEYARLAPQDFEAHFQLGAVYEVLAERLLNDSLTNRTIQELRQALAIQPGHAMSHYYLSKAYRRLGLYDEADREYELYERFLAR